MKKLLNIRDVIGYLLIISGILIIAYPQLQSYYYDKKQEKLLEEYLQSMEVINVIEEERQAADTNLNSFPSPPTNGDNSQDAGREGEKEEKEQEELEKKWPVEATIYIEKINLIAPILSGATKEHLNISVASIENTGKPWEGNNYAVAGHRSRAFGRHFSRLNELEIGDKIIVEDRERNKYIYEVYDKFIVDKKDISVLEDRGISEITLITCEPINQKNPPTRLIVKGKKLINI